MRFTILVPSIYILSSCLDLFFYLILVIFAGSISLMPDPVGALHATAKLLKPNGKIYITQTFQRRGAMFLSYLKV
jgi:hypothetical protein